MKFLSDQIYYVEILAFDQSVSIRHFWDEDAATRYSEEAEKEGCYWARIYYLDSTIADGSIQCFELEK